MSVNICVIYVGKGIKNTKLLIHFKSTKENKKKNYENFFVKPVLDKIDFGLAVTKK